MSERDKHARLDRQIDQAVDEFLSVPDSVVLDRVKELTGTKESVALNFDRLIAPILNESKPRKEGDLRVQSAASFKPAWPTSLAWLLSNSSEPVFSSRPMRSVLALLFVVAGAGLSIPLWRGPIAPDSNDLASNRPSRAVRDTLNQQTVDTSAGGDGLYMVQLAKSLSFSRTAEALDRVNAKYSNLFRERSLVIRRANSGDEPNAYIGGVAGIRSVQDAEQVCSKIRAGGDPCEVVKVPND